MQGVFAAALDYLRRDEAFALATIAETRDGGSVHSVFLGAKILVRGDDTPIGSLGSPQLDAVVAQRLHEALVTSRGGALHCGVNGEDTLDDLSIFVEVFPRRPRMIIFGAVDFTRALVKAAKTLDYRVTVCDARRTFATVERFPEADHVAVDWPDRYLRSLSPALGPSDAICVLTHDQKFDAPALIEALQTRAGYIGAMGSRQTTTTRRERLRAMGVGAAQLDRLMAPIGIDIGARSPEETAIAICAEIIATRSGTPVPSLRYASGPIHREAPRGEDIAQPYSRIID